MLPEKCAGIKGKSPLRSAQTAPSPPTPWQPHGPAALCHLPAVPGALQGAQSSLSIPKLHPVLVPTGVFTSGWGLMGRGVTKEAGLAAGRVLHKTKGTFLGAGFCVFCCFFLIQYSVFWGFFFECEQTKFDLSRSQVRKWLYEETAKQNHPPPSAT